MRYPKECKNIIDITKPPYCADPTGKEDCTAAIIRALDDYLGKTVTELEKTRKKLYELSDGLKEDAHIGMESGRVWDGVMTVTFPEFLQDAVIFYFPKGIYRITDTITYSLKNLNTNQWENYTCELCRRIHFLGEDRENTIIRLDDNAPGFRELKPVLSFNTASKPYDESESTNCAMQNTVRDLTIDCGSGNDKAIGIYYVSSNLGRMENVEIKAQGGHCGIYFDIGSEGVFRDLKISGFDYGIESGYTSPVVLDRVDLSGNRIAGITSMDATMILRGVSCGKLPALALKKAHHGRYYLYDPSAVVVGDECGNSVYRKKEEELLHYRPLPENPYRNLDSDYVIVDDFGAVGDGVTDSTRAIQRAMNSGKPIVLFGKGRYLIENTVKIPATVKVVDFMYGDLALGIEVITGEADAVFEISEDSNDPLYIQNLTTHEQAFGYARLIRHAAKRDAVLSDLYTPFLAQYYNTVGGSTVYIDNCFLTSGSYPQGGWLKRGYKPVFCDVLPWEFHDQTVYASNLNIERGNIEFYNDHSDIYIDGYKTEGAGCALKSVNGGRTRINLCNNGIWNNTIEENALYRLTESELEMCGVVPFWFDPKNRACLTALDIDGERQNLLDIGEEDSAGEEWRLIRYFKTEK